MASPRLRRNRNSHSGRRVQVKAVLGGSIWALAVSVVVFGVVALLLTYTGVPERVVPTLSLLTSLVTVFIGGFKAAIRAGVNGWLHGVLTSLVYYVVVVAVGVLAFDKSFGLVALWRYLPLLLAGAFGGILGVK